MISLHFFQPKKNLRYGIQKQMHALITLTINFIKNLLKIAMIIFIYLTEKKKGALEEYSLISCSTKISQKAYFYWKKFQNVTLKPTLN